MSVVSADHDERKCRAAATIINDCVVDVFLVIAHYYDFFFVISTAENITPAQNKLGSRG